MPDKQLLETIAAIVFPLLEKELEVERKERERARVKREQLYMKLYKEAV